jgi:uncharacterized protein
VTGHLTGHLTGRGAGDGAGAGVGDRAGDGIGGGTDGGTDRGVGGGTSLMVIAKAPVAGRVKTRLTPPYTPDQAAVLAEAALADTLEVVAATPAGRRVLVLDGAPGRWLPSGFEVIEQRGGGLDERLAHAFVDTGGPAVLIGMDTPQITADLLTAAVRRLHGCDAVFGPAADGGFWLLGLREPDPALLRGVPMSRPDTGARQLTRLRARGLRVAPLGSLVDVDTAADAALVAAQAPGTRFAAAVRTQEVRTQAVDLGAVGTGAVGTGAMRAAAIRAEPVRS